MTQPERVNHSRLTPGADLDIPRAGAHLGIPADAWDQPAITELIGFLVRVEELQQDLFAAGLDARDERLPFLDGAHTLAERYHAAETLLRIVLALLREGFGVWHRRLEPGSSSLGYLDEKLQTALAVYGLRVTLEDVPADDEP